MEFREERDFAACGMACFLCTLEDCPGCKAGADGCAACASCPCRKDNDGCRIKQCAREKGVEGCCVCPEFPCHNDWGPFQVGKRNKSFNRYAREFGKQALIDRLRVNQENGIAYEDYDAPEKEFQVYQLLRYGRDEAAKNKKPEITVKPLSPELTEDWFSFFNLRAFTDNPPWGGCWCQFPQMSKEDAIRVRENPEWYGEGGIVRWQHRTRAIRGYLAYVDGFAIGWCNANDRANLPVEAAFGPSHYAPAERKEKAVLCFEIAPEYRGRGVATALLQRVIDDARAEGFNAVEAYPSLPRKRDEHDFRGPIRLFEKAGFVVAKKARLFEKDKSLTMRLELK